MLGFLTAISGFLLQHAYGIGLAGGAFLVYLGAKILISNPSINGTEEQKVSHPRAFLSTLGLTLANPPTILAFVAIFAGIGLGANPSPGAAALVVLGVFLGSALWWLILASAAGARGYRSSSTRWARTAGCRWTSRAARSPS